MKSLIAWFANNGVVANLMMLMIIALGLMTVTEVNKEVFPEFEADLIAVTVPYRGATPEEVEEAVCIRIEEAIHGLEGVEKMTSTATEGSGSVLVQVETGYEIRELLDDVKARVDAISTFPAETEKPMVKEMLPRLQVINVSLYGDTDELTLKRLGEKVRDEITALPEISQADLKSVRPYEIAIEISEDTLRRHNLTFDDVVQAVRRSSLNMPGGSVKTDSGEILLRTKGQSYRGEEYEALTLMTRADGSRLLLSDVARVVDGFEETDQLSRFDGKPSVMIQVFRVGDEDTPDVAASIHRYVEEVRPRLPSGISIATWQDSSVILEDRTNLLLRNGLTGLVLVFIVLSMFLRMRLAIWVVIGIPVAFLGAFATMPYTGITINMMTLFAFILVLGIVVDDAIIVAERIHYRQNSHEGVKGAIMGTQEVTTPVIFGVLTTMVAFAPFMMVPGVMGNFTRAFPLVVIPVLAFSVIESQLVLPYHLSHIKKDQNVISKNIVLRAWETVFNGFGKTLQWFISEIYKPGLEFALNWRYLTASVGIASLLLTIGLIRGGLVEFVFFPQMDSDTIIVKLTMPQETPAETTSKAIESIELMAIELGAELENQHGLTIFTHVLSSVGEQPSSNSGPGNPGIAPARAYLGEVQVELVSGENRLYSSGQLASMLRERLTPIPGAVELEISSDLIGGTGKPIDFQLAGSDIEELRSASHDIRTRLAKYPGVTDINDSFRGGKPEIELTIKESAEPLGLSMQDLGRQVRQGFFGEEIQRIQRGRDDVRVMVRYPKGERQSLGYMESMRIRTSEGQEVPFATVANAEFGRGLSSIVRVDRQRAINVTAGVNEETANANAILSDFQSRQMPEVLSAHPGVTYTMEGEQRIQGEFLEGLLQGFLIALFIMFALMAIPFKSYSQPFIVMSAVPFGLVGAVLGHAILDMPLNFMSVMGMVAVAGVVVNDSLVLVHFINNARNQSGLLMESVISAGAARFRPILLTSLTTAAGVTPLILETSIQAQTLVPMAVSVAFGVLFATLISLCLVPSIYLILDDVKTLLRLTVSSRPSIVQP